MTVDAGRDWKGKEGMGKGAWRGKGHGRRKEEEKEKRGEKGEHNTLYQEIDIYSELLMKGDKRT